MKYVVYSKPGCPWCVKVMNLLKFHKKDFEVIDINKDEEAFDFIRNRLGYRFVPQVFEDHGGGELVRIGGFEETWDHLKKT